MKRYLCYFTKGEWALWLGSVTSIVVSFALFGQTDYLTLCASLIGVTSLIFCAKGNPIGQGFMVVFSLLYGYISYTFSYYGELITYLGMTLPMTIVALISWLRHPYQGNRGQVEVHKLTARECQYMCLLTLLVTVLFYFILAYFQTANLLPSTLSVTTSFMAVYLTYKRSPYYAVAYACNDLVLIVLWVLATMRDMSYLSVVVCFVAFFINDIYGFISWRNMANVQNS